MEDTGVHTNCQKVNVIARLGFELAYNDFAVQRFNPYTTKTPPIDANAGKTDSFRIVTSKVARLALGLFIQINVFIYYLLKLIWKPSDMYEVMSYLLSWRAKKKKKTPKKPKQKTNKKQKKQTNSEEHWTTYMKIMLRGKCFIRH